MKQTWFGDANLDRKVDFDDFLSLSASFGGHGSWSQGDFDLDGRVTFDDFLWLADNFGNGEQQVVSVPEQEMARDRTAYLLCFPCVAFAIIREDQPIARCADGTYSNLTCLDWLALTSRMFRAIPRSPCRFVPIP